MTKTATQYFLQALFEDFCYRFDYPGEPNDDSHEVLFDDDGLNAFMDYLEKYGIYMDGPFESLATFGVKNFNDLRKELSTAYDIDAENGDDPDWNSRALS